MAYGRRSTTSSILEVFSLNPLPYPVLLILSVTFIFLGVSWYMSLEDTVETAGQQVGWILLVVPVILLLLALWISSMDPDSFFSMNPWDQRRRTHHVPSEGGSPWGVAAVIVLLLVLLQYQSVFRDSWMI